MVANVKKIFVVSDILMTKESEQAINRKWVLDLLFRPILMGTGVRAEGFASSLVEGEGRFSRKKFFELSGMKVDLEELQWWFDGGVVSDASVAYLKGFLGGDVLLVGYELSEATRGVLDRVGVSYVDMWLHPIRFLDDVLFAFGTNRAEVWKGLKGFHMKDGICWTYADRLKIGAYKGWKRPELKLEEGSAVFVGQTLQDKAVCRDGKMLTVVDFEAKFRELCAGHKKVYYSRHPFVKSGDEAVMAFLKGFSNVEVTTATAYHLLCDSRVKTVMSVSSSVALESRYFGKKVEVLYRPVVDLGVAKLGQYCTVYQTFVSPHFWAGVLRDVMVGGVKAGAEEIAFQSGKDKLRDMLAFYWSYGTIDKVEGSRQQLIAVDNRLQKVAVGVEEVKKGVVGVEAKLRGAEVGGAMVEYVPEAKWYKDVEARMKKARVVSFDVFDTVVSRPGHEEADGFFDIFAGAASKLVGCSVDEFIKLRKECRKWAVGYAVGEEIPLMGRYMGLCEHRKLPRDVGVQLYQLELMAELQACRARGVGVELLEMARRLGKRVIFVSDIYWEAQAMEDILGRCGVEADAVYLSSEAGKLKHSGKLFDEVFAAEMGVIGKDVGSMVVGEVVKEKGRLLHIGDNRHSDVEMGKKAGWEVLHVPSAGENFGYLKYGGVAKYGDRLTNGVLRGVVAHGAFDRPNSYESPSYFGGGAQRFGWVMAAPIFVGFAKWVMEQAIRDGVEVLYFLARDGDIVKQCYDRLARHEPRAPRSEYILASRRSVNVAGVKDVEDAVRLLEVNWTPCGVGELMKNRFGYELSEGDVGILRRVGYRGVDAVADFKRDAGGRMAELVRLLWEESGLQRSVRDEREAYEEYLRSKGVVFGGGVKAALVDIGHIGTMQRSMSRVVGDAKLGAYYFVTYEGVKAVRGAGLWSKAWLADCLDGKPSSHAYCRHLLMFELLFLNDTGSFVKMVKSGGDLKAVHLDVVGEQARIDFIRKVYTGVHQWLNRLLALHGTRLSQLKWSGDEAIRGYVAFIEGPTKEDAEVLKGVAFENVYSGRAVRYILAPDAKGESLWKEGALVVHGSGEEQAPKSVGYRVLEWWLEAHGAEKKLRKLRQDPKAFFRDSGVVGRVVGKLVGGSGGDR